MIIPQFEYEPLVDITTGNLSPEWQLWFTQLITQMTQNVGTQGFVIPQLDAADIAAIKTAGLATAGAVANGTLIYDSDNNLLKIWIVNDFKTITTS